jgi:hypothetical protein
MKNEKKSLFALDQKSSSWYGFAWISWFMIMNLIEERKHKGDDHGNQNKRPVNIRKPAQKADLWQV